MRTLIALFIIILGFNPIGLFSQPKLNELVPGKVYTQNIIPPIYNTEEMPENYVKDYITVPVELELKVDKLSSNINESNVKDRVKVFLRKGDQFEQVKVHSWKPGAVTVLVMSNKWLTNNTAVAVYAEADDVRTNTIFLEVINNPTVAPTISKLNRDRVTVTNEVAYVKIYGSNLGRELDMSVKFNGIAGEISSHDFMGGWMDVWLPESVRKTPGIYSLVAENTFGKSNSLTLIVEKPLIKVAPIAKAPKPQPSARQQKTLDEMPPKSKTPITVYGTGIKVNLSGTTTIAHKTYLEEYISELDQVKKVENNLTIETMEKVSIKLKGSGVEKVSMNHVKLSIEKKLRALGITGDVIIE